MDSKSYSSNLSSFIQPPYSGSPFNLVSGEYFSSPSRVMDKVQQEHADQNVAWNHYISSPRMISLLSHFMRKNELCHGFFLRWTNFYFSKSRIARFWNESLFAHGIPLGYKLKNTHLAFGFISRGQVSGLNFLFSLSMKLTSICLNDLLHSFKTMIESQGAWGIFGVEGCRRVGVWKSCYPSIRDWLDLKKNILQ